MKCYREDTAPITTLRSKSSILSGRSPGLHIACKVNVLTVAGAALEFNQLPVSP